MKDHSHVNLSIFAAVLVLAMVTIACGINFKLPVNKIETGPTQTENIQIPMPADPSANIELNLEFTGGDLKLAPGASGYLAVGTATYNAAELAPELETSGASATLRSGNLESDDIPILDKDVQNEWDLQLANTPMSLNIKAGAYNGRLELGGLSLENLTVSEGGSDMTGAFTEPNLIEMSSFEYSTGASSVNLKGLANANFKQMSFSSGAGDYTLSFDGDLRGEENVTIDSGLGSVNIIVPEGFNAQVIFDGALTKITTSGSWVQNENVYSLSGSGPMITIKVSMGAGALNLKTE